MRVARHASAGFSAVGQAARGGEAADARLSKAQLLERALHAQFREGAHPRAVVAHVVGVCAVQDHAEAARRASCSILAKSARLQM